MWSKIFRSHYDEVIMTTMASQITSLTVVYSSVYSDADQRKHQSSASLAFVWRIHRDRWIPRIKGQLQGKRFHLMTSSWCFVACSVSNHCLTQWWRVVSLAIRKILQWNRKQSFYIFVYDLRCSSSFLMWEVSCSVICKSMRTDQMINANP